MSAHRIHPTALIAPEAELADDVEIGAYALIEGTVRLGPGCVVRPHAHLIGPLRMGAGNFVGTACVLGERPQHFKYADEPTGTIVGDHNVFREHVTIHRGTTASGNTVIGSHNYLMVNSHIAHDCRIGDHCIFANGALVAGHCVVEDRAYLSGNCAIVQFIRVGRLAMLGGLSATTKDVVPFVIHHGYNRVVGVNVVGMRRAGLSNAEITAVRQAYRILFFQGLILPAALERIEREFVGVESVAEMVRFIRQAKRGICSSRSNRGDDEDDRAAA